MPLPLARTPAEERLYIDLHPCECGEVRTESESHALLEYAGALASQHRDSCRGCGHSRRFAFLLPDWPLQSPTFRFGDDMPSAIIDPGEWLWIADISATATLQEAGSEVERREGMEYAAAAAAEVLKFLAPGADDIPDHLFPSDLGKAVRKACPSAFRRRELHEHVERLRSGQPPPDVHDVAIPWDHRRARPSDLMRNTLLDGILDRIRRYVGGDTSVVLNHETLVEIDALLGPNRSFDLMASFESAWVHWLRCEQLPEDQRQDDLAAALRLFAAVIEAAPRYDATDLVDSIPPAARLLLTQRDRRG